MMYPLSPSSQIVSRLTVCPLTRPSYAVAEEQEMFAEFLAGEPRPFPDVPWYRAWYDQIATLTSQGKRVERVRLLDEPPTDYQWFEDFVDVEDALADESLAPTDKGAALLEGPHAACGMTLPA